MNFKYKLMILTAGILALTSSLLTALGMAELFQGLFIIFLVIDLGRFLVLNFVVDEWKNLRGIKWLICIILGILFLYSAVGVYNKLNSMIPQSIQTAMVEAASYNRAQDNAETKQTRSENLADIAQKEYTTALQWNATDYENCMKRANGDSNAENKCNNTKRRLDNSASSNLKKALKDADTALDNTQAAVAENTKNQSEIAGVLTTVCRILPNTDCKTYNGLQTALTIIILLTICGLDYLQLCIVLAVNTRKNKKESIEEENNTSVPPINENKKAKAVKKDDLTVDLDTSINININKEQKLNKLKKYLKIKVPKINISSKLLKNKFKIQSKKIQKNTENTINKHKKAAKPFSQETGFYK